MSVTVVNVGMYERSTSGARTTNYQKAQGDQGAVRVVWEGIEHTFGPGDSKTFAEDSMGISIAALDGRLRVADTRDGRVKGGAS